MDEDYQILEAYLLEITRKMADQANFRSSAVPGFHLFQRAISSQFVFRNTWVREATTRFGTR